MPSDAPRPVPPKRKATPVAAAPPPLAGIVAPLDAEEPEPALFSLETLKGLMSSVILHAVLLIALALWVFVPKRNEAKTITTRLAAGSEMGVEDGLTNKGGLNSIITMPEAPAPTPADPVPMSLRPLDVASLEPKIQLSGATTASADGGFKSNNAGAGAGDGFGLARFGQGGETIRGIEVKVGDPQFTLIWDNDVDLDLHVIEPGGKEIYWEDPKGKLGGELDVDNTKGFGPENIYWLREDDSTGEKVRGPGPSGKYEWFVVYWGGFGGVSKPTHWKVRIKHEGKLTVVTGRFKALNERSKMHTLIVKPSGAVASETPAPAPAPAPAR